MLKTFSLACLLSLSALVARQQVDRSLISIGSHVNVIGGVVWVEKPIRLDCEIPQVHLYVVDTGTGDPVEAFERIALSHNGRAALLRGLLQLRGLVRITDGGAALRFVRLRTAPVTWYMWPDAHRELEVVEGGQQGGLPTFGLRTPYTNEVVTSGWEGIIPSRVYRGIGFGPAKVKQAPGGFVITRWTFSGDWDRDHYHTSIQKINEFVRADGDYKRTVLARIDPRRVPALWFPTFE